MNNLAQDNSPSPKESRPMRRRITGGFRALVDLIRRLLPLTPDFFLILLIVAGVVFRFSWTNWSEGTNIHPDEMGLTNTLTQLSIPNSIEGYFNTRISPLSPYQKYDEIGNPTMYGPDNSMRWGQWPQILLRAAAEGLQGSEEILLPRINAWKASRCPAGVDASPAASGCEPVRSYNFLGYNEIRLLGRTLSALTDLITLLVCLAIGLRLYNRRIALMGTALSALAVMQIQESHFMTVDNFAVMFSILGMYCAVRAAQKGGWKWYALFGIFYAMTLASRINMAPLGAMIAIAAWMAHREEWMRNDLPWRQRFGPAVGQMALAVAVTLLVFRVTQPMSFRAPTGDTGFFTIQLNDDWVRSMKVAQQESNGIGGPPAEHWANRPLIITPFLSIVLWGMGLFLGLTAFGGLLWAGFRLYRGVDWQKHAIPVLFTGGMFLFLGTRRVMEMRYFLVIYPYLCLLAAWAIMELQVVTRPGRGARGWRILAGTLAVVVPLATLIWAWTFTGIYRNENTRVQASRWAFQNFPAAFSLDLRLPSGEQYVQGISFYGQTIGTDPVRMSFNSNKDGRVETFSLGHVRDLSGAADSSLKVSLFSEPPGDQPLAEAEIVIPPLGSDPRGQSATAALGPVDLKRGAQYHLEVQAVRGGPFSVEGASFVYEDWDDPVPQNLDGLDADLMFNRSTVKTIEVMWPDNQEKRDMFVQTLSDVDYIVIPSQRRMWSVCRMPAVYPMTMEYYRALFDGRLGFDLVAMFQSPLSIGPLRISDLAGTVSWGEDPQLPIFNLNPLAAEESFSVYDHAPVWIFQKRADFSADRVRAVLGAVDISHVVRQDPTLPFGVLNGLMLPTDDLKVQQAGGTWSEMFSYEWLWNKYPGLSAVLWWLWAVLTGWATLPIVGKIFRGLPDEGYSAAKIAGWLLVAWAAWILGSLKIPFVWTTIALVWLVLVVIGGILGWRERARWKESFRKLWKTWLILEIVFAAFFLFELLLRLGNGDLWHEVSGGEKPMEFSYLNAVIKSTTFPPYDPWFAGGYLNYYYFGYVLIAIPIKLLGTVPSIGFNLALPLVDGTLCVTAFGLAWNVAENLRRKGQWHMSPVIAGLAAVCLLALLGNLGDVKMLWDSLVSASMLPIPHGLFFGLGDILHALSGVGRVVLGQAGIPFGVKEWYWRATREVLFTDATFAEFPIFSFVFADLHAHVIAMPLVIFALVGPVAMVIAPDRLNRWRSALPLVALSALAVGSLWPTNSWNYPVSLAIAVVGLLLAGWRMLEQGPGLKDWRGWIRVLLLVSLLIGLSVWLFQPYYQWYGVGYNAVEQWKGAKTRLDAYLIHFGLFLFILVTYLVWQTRKWLARIRISDLKNRNELGMILLVSASILLAGLVVIGSQGYPVLVLAIPLILWAVILGLWGGLEDEHRVVMGLIAIALMITVVLELVVLRGDMDRMNTVFKFYLQVWNLLAIAAGVALCWLVSEMETWRRWIRKSWQIGLGILAVGCLFYTVMASFSKSIERMSSSTPRTLDGITFMEYSTYTNGPTPETSIHMILKEDYDGIRWMQQNVIGSPVIVEGHTLEYQWGARFTVFTGLPGVLGWNYHQRQQRGVVDDSWVWDRVSQIEGFYETNDLDEARSFLRKYNVRYIVLGQHERAFYPGPGLYKFEAMRSNGELKVVFFEGQTIIYEVVDLQL